VTPRYDAGNGAGVSGASIVLAEAVVELWTSAAGIEFDVPHAAASEPTANNTATQRKCFT
jgi:hypothetical protein